MNRIVLSTALTLVAATPFTMHGEDSPETDNLNRFSLGSRFGMNFKAKFHNSAVNSPGDPGSNIGPATGGADHEYQDGYVLLDSSGNAGGLTWNWGYQNSSQVVGDTMQFHSTQTTLRPLPAKNEVTDDPQYGLELTYQRTLGHFGSSGHWGFEVGFGYSDIDLRDDRTAQGLATTTTDSFALNGVLPPGPGYQGTYLGPGALLGTPQRAPSPPTSRR